MLHNIFTRRHRLTAYAIAAITAFSATSCDSENNKFEAQQAGYPQEVPTPVAPAASIPLPDPSTLKGVHWKTYTIPKYDNNHQLISAEVMADPKDSIGGVPITDAQKVAMCASWGINCIALKLEDGGQLTEELDGSIHDDPTLYNSLTQTQKDILNTARAEGAAKFIKAVYDWDIAHPDKRIYVILFTRKWFQREGVKVNGNMEDAAQIFADVINRCKTGGYDDALVGVIPVENRIDAMDFLLPYCLEFADDLNAATDNWLKRKTLFFSGLGLGISFKGYPSKKVATAVGIDSSKGSDTFWNDIQSRCAAFCWVEKYYKKTDNEPTLGKYVAATNLPDNTYEDALRLLQTQYGLSNLKTFVDRAPSEMYNNVMFWGDASDGIRLIPAPIRDALKTIWLVNKFGAASFDHLFLTNPVDADSANGINDDTSEDKEEKRDYIGYLNNGVLTKSAVFFDPWTKFFDGSFISSYRGGGKTLKTSL